MTEREVSLEGVLTEVSLMTNSMQTFPDCRDSTRILIEDSTKPLPAPAQKRLILSNEMGIRVENPEWEIIEAVIHQMNPGRGNSFCILEDPRRGFVQALHGFNGYHLEWNEGSSGSPGPHQLLRGAYPGGSTKSIELKKNDRISAGEYRDLLPIEEVIDVFLAFYRSKGKPEWLTWRPIDT